MNASPPMDASLPTRADVERRWVDYDYAVVRVVPSVARGGFVNVGVVLHARQARLLQVRCHAAPHTLAGLDAVPAHLLRDALHAYATVCDGTGVIGRYPPSERFHWLTAPRSAMVQCSPVHNGRSSHIESVLTGLFEAYVGASGGR